MDEASGSGFSPINLAVPLVTGGSVHKGLARLMEYARTNSDGKLLDSDIEYAVMDAVKDYQDRVSGRKFDLEQLESQSFVYNEQLALVEALVRLAGIRVIPKILEIYEVLEVEKLDKALLVQDEPLDYAEGGGLGESQWRVDFRSIPDALLRSRADGDLYVLSWKTTSEFDQRKDQDARVDMQGLSEPWALEQRLKNWEALLADPQDGPYPAIPKWFQEHVRDGGGTSIRGVQMIYLVKGSRRKQSKENMIASGVTAGQIASGGAQYKTASPLIYGYMNDPSGMSPVFAFSSDWKCSKSHPMRKSQWYPLGTCPGDGRTHKRGDEWKSFPVWEQIGVKDWISRLNSGEISPEAGDPLDQSWAMPVPHFRTRESVESWLRQTQFAEGRLARDLMVIREYESAIQDALRDGDNFLLNEAQDGLIRKLDESFPQSTEKCSDWFHRLCPMHSVCWGPPHVQQDPVGSGLFRIKEQYEPMEVGV
jgi:hypothetical protein